MMKLNLRKRLGEGIILYMFYTNTSFDHTSPDKPLRSHYSLHKFPEDSHIQFKFTLHSLEL